jgi:hypothetical protein
MVSSIVSTALVPLRGNQADSAADALSRRTRADAGPFTPEDAQPEIQGGQPPIAGGRGTAGTLPLLRRRTDRGETADPGISVPPHLERRRAWREAFGLNTWHTQQLAQGEADEDETPSRDATVTAVRAYRSTAWRGRLDLDLAQRISVTV